VAGVVVDLGDLLGQDGVALLAQRRAAGAVGVVGGTETFRNSHARLTLWLPAFSASMNG
jgi:hypothetical protein